MDNNVEFVRLVGTERRVGSKLAEVSRHWQGDKEKFLFVSPHDDDAVLGGGLLMQLAKRENVPVHILIVTDGSMGYCSDEEKDQIADIRRQETFDCYQSLDIPKENIVWLGFPDCRLNHYRGRSVAEANDPQAIEGYVGLQNSFTHYLRKIRPTQCFLPTRNDLHPDHQFVYDEFLISLFHASGAIWPELGSQLSKVPYVHEMAVYCDFPEAPSLRMKTSEEYLDRKLNAIAAFRSQKQIATLIDNVRHYGPEEFIRALEFRLYNPSIYHDRFEHKKTMSPLR